MKYEYFINASSFLDYCVFGCTEYPRLAIKPGVEAPGVSARVRDQDTRSFEYLQRQHP